MGRPVPFTHYPICMKQNLLTSPFRISDLRQRLWLMVSGLLRRKNSAVKWHVHDVRSSHRRAIARIIAPVHFDPRPEIGSIDKMPLERFYTEAICLDLSCIPPGHSATVAEMERAIAQSGQEIGRSDTVLIHRDQRILCPTNRSSRYHGWPRYTRDVAFTGALRGGQAIGDPRANAIRRSLECRNVRRHLRSTKTSGRTRPQQHSPRLYWHSLKIHRAPRFERAVCSKSSKVRYGHEAVGIAGATCGLGSGADSEAVGTRANVANRGKAR